MGACFSRGRGSGTWPGARVRRPGSYPARLGAAGVVAAAELHHRRHGSAPAVALWAVARDAAEGQRSMTTFHPHLLDRRLRVVRGLVWAVFGVIVLAFFRTQILGHGKYQLQAETNRLRPIPLLAPRGVIVDRNG